MALSRKEARERGIIGSGNTFNEPSADGPGDDVSNPSTGQSGDSEVAMDVYGGQQTTIAEVIKRVESVEDPEPGAPDIETKVVQPPLPKDIKVVDPEDKPLKRPPTPVNPPPPKPEFITEEKDEPYKIVVLGHQLAGVRDTKDDPDSSAANPLDSDIHD